MAMAHMVDKAAVAKDAARQGKDRFRPREIAKPTEQDGGVALRTSILAILLRAPSCSVGFAISRGRNRSFPCRYSSSARWTRCSDPRFAPVVVAFL
jgi:hypothetical protein